MPVKARDPRELLAKWAQEDALDVLGPWVSAAEASTRPSREVSVSPSVPLPEAVARDNRNEQPEQATPSVPATPPAFLANAATDSPPVAHVPDQRSHERIVRIKHVAHAPAESGSPPTADAGRVSDRLARAIRDRRSVAVAGQLAAYCGVLALTAGALLLFAGHFSKLDNYIPMGWLAMISGQMLLFLGVVTLISSGMEQTTAAVAHRVESLGQRLLRIEAAAELSGPHWPGDRQVEDDDSSLDPAEQDLEAEIARLTQALAERRRVNR